jgi:small GTP-binding protein
MATIGADFAKKDTKIHFEGEDYIIESLIWDLAGQDAYKIVRESFYEAAAGALLVVDITRRDTFLSTDKWITELWTNNGSGPIPFVILANKSDLRSKEPEAALSKEETDKLVEEICSRARLKAPFNYIFFETSAIDGINVNEAFDALLREILTNTLKKGT